MDGESEPKHNATITIGDYTVDLGSDIGGGTFGTVYIGTHTEHGYAVAAKKIRVMDGNTRNDYVWQMAEREISFLRSLKDHDNIVKLYDHSNTSKQFWLFMEYCDLGNLHRYMMDNFDLPFEPRIQIMNELASALSFMHGFDPPVIHRDIKLENLMMKQEGQKHTLKVADFGLSKVFEGPQNLSAIFNKANFMTTTCGSRFFMAPEFFAELDGGLKYESSVDVFAAGLVFRVVLNASKTDDLVPLSVEAKKDNTLVPIGHEIIVCHNKNKPLPIIATIDSEDAKVPRRVKRIIMQMTRLWPGERKDIHELDKEMKEILEDIHDTKLLLETKAQILQEYKEGLGRRNQRDVAIQTDDKTRKRKFKKYLNENPTNPELYRERPGAKNDKKANARSRCFICLSKCFSLFWRLVLFLLYVCIIYIVLVFIYVGWERHSNVS